MYSSGTGGGGGAATIAVIDGNQIFAGGGGGTGGTGRQASNANLQSGAGFQNATSQTSISNGVAGENNTASDNDGSCYSNAGAGGGGGGGYKGGNRGNYGAASCPTPFSSSTSGYPGSNGTTNSFLTVTSNIHTKSVDSATGSLGGVAVIVLVYKGTTTATLSLPAGNLVFRQATTISNTSTVAGKITFRANGKILPGCKNKVATANVAVTCSYKPSTRNSVTITATLNPTNPDFIGTVSVSAQLQVANRTGPRVP
jgi:hypothetical protein